jgi:hypothetical protein
MNNQLKINIGALMILVMLPLLSFSQTTVNITPQVGYMFGGSLRGYEGRIDVDDKINYGGTIGFGVLEYTQIELTYFRQDSRARIERYGFFENIREFDLATSYYQLGILQETQSGNVRPFGLLSFGATVFNPKEDDLDSKTFFSTIFGGGVNAYINDRIGVRLMGRLMVPVAFGSGSLFCGIGGCSVGYASYATLVQGDFSLGITLRLGEE